MERDSQQTVAEAITRLLSRLDVMETELTRLREALTFYGHAPNYFPKREAGGAGAPMGRAPVVVGKGQIAREALHGEPFSPESQALLEAFQKELLAFYLRSDLSEEIRCARWRSQGE